MVPASFHICDAVEKWPGSEEPNQTVETTMTTSVSGLCIPLILPQGFAIAHETDKSMFDYLSDHPEKAKYFYNAMRAFAKQPGLQPKYIVEGYPWGSLPDGATGESPSSTPGVLYRLRFRVQ